MGRPKKGTEDWRPLFLAALAEGYHVRDAAIRASVDSSAVYAERKTNPAFAKGWGEAHVTGTRELEREASRRAYHGELRPVYQGGELVGHIREYSDSLLMFLLKARRPGKYRENVSVEHNGFNGLLLRLTKMNDAELDALEADLDRTAQTEASDPAGTGAPPLGTPGT
jgi:hypothetical protein